MRALAIVVIAACGPRIHAVHPDTARDEAGCKARGNAIEVAAPDADAPIAVLFERGSFHVPLLPSVVVWADGTVLWAKSEFEWAIEHSDGAVAIAREVPGDLRRSTRYAEATTDTMDLRTIEIVARDDRGWRVSKVYGVERGASGDGFAAAYRRLAAFTANDAGKPYTPVDLDVTLEAFADARGEQPWPPGVPPPPAVAGTYVISGDFGARLAPISTDRDAIVLDGKKWRMRTHPRYRGQATIDRVLHCARERDDD
jgi:hypothetical protein